MNLPTSNISDQPVIIGAGLAGLMTAIRLAPEPVIVLSGEPLGTGAASGWAQGGVAAAVGPDDDPLLHLKDTLAAGDGLCDPAIVERVVRAAPDVIRELADQGVEFDHDGDGHWSLGLEAAHSRRRILHADGDATGAAILRALIAAARATASITILEGVTARRLLVRDNAVYGVWAQTSDGPLVIHTHRVVLATGGLGGLYEHTTNPASAIGLGLAMAARAGAAMADMEFVQFHPTALDAGLDPMPLISEAVRGEGATLIDETGHRFMAGQGRAELDPRDVVARAVWRQLQEGHRVFLDSRACLGTRFSERFPGIFAACQAVGIDPSTDPIPVVPAAHFHVGGVAVNESGRTSVRGLWACGEVAASGLHGANRLASNSLLEAAASAAWVAEDVAGQPAGLQVMWKAGNLESWKRGELPLWLPGNLAASNFDDLESQSEMPPASAKAVRCILTGAAGVLRDAKGLQMASARLLDLIIENGPAADPAITASLIVEAALRRKESRGGHFRTDYPDHDPHEASRKVLYLAELAPQNVAPL